MGEDEIWICGGRREKNNEKEGRKIMNRGKERGKSQDNAEERRMVCGEEGRRIMTRKWGGY